MCSSGSWDGGGPQEGSWSGSLISIRVKALNYNRASKIIKVILRLAVYLYIVRINLHLQVTAISTVKSKIHTSIIQSVKYIAYLIFIFNMLDSIKVT